MPQRDPFHEIHGISARRLQFLEQNNVQTFQEFLNLSIDQLLDILNIEQPEQVNDIREKISLYQSHCIRILQPFELPASDKVLFFDIEAKPNRSKEMFLISFKAVNTPVVTFFKDDNSFFSNIQNYLDEAPQTVLVSSSGNNWDYQHLKEAYAQRKGNARNPIKQFKSLDLMSYFKKRIISPVGFSVKLLSKYFGYQELYEPTEDPRITRLQSLYPHISIKKKTGYFLAKVFADGLYDEATAQAMIEYNQSDVFALDHIFSSLKRYENKTGIQEC